jgi:AAA+ ATPase superfamily predicted ATPase
MNFVGRKRELEVLEEAWRSPRSGFIPIYGRRRVGKSELILRFMDGKGGLYFVGKRAPVGAQIQEFVEIAARTADEPLLAQTRPPDWKAALESLAGRWKGTGKFILVMDEFQWIVESSPELPSVLQELWDRHWAKSGRILLILCGSYLGFMEREVLGRKSPLFGRRTAQILLHPFNHLEAAQFQPNYSVADQARVYAVCGGIPAYLLEFDGGLSVEQNIIRRLLDESGPLAREPEFLLREELRDLPRYHAVLTALAGGETSPSLLARASGVDVRGLVYYLNTLMQLGYVERRYPLTGTRASVRSVRYALDDPLLRFWFRFVFPHQSLLRQLGPQRSFSELVRPELESYFGHCFERLCREVIPMFYAREAVRGPFTIGEYWDAQTQIDVVGVRGDNWTDLGECKWGSPVSASALRTELKSRAARFPNQRGASIGLRFFTRARLSRKIGLPANERWYSLEDLYSV